MANEIQIFYPDGNNLYALIRRASDGYIWNTATNQFEAVGSWNDSRVDECDIPLTGYEGELYMADFPVVSAGRYLVSIYLKAGDNPAIDDTLIGEGQILWTGTGELTADKVLSNKAVQNKTTGAIQYFDDDGQTVILTHTVTDSESTITRQPE